MSVATRNGIRGLELGSAPSSPASGQRLLYPKSDGWYEKTSAGVETKVGPGAASGTKVSALTAVTTLADADVLPIVNGSASKKVTLTQLTTYFEQRARQHNASVATQSVGASDTYITGSNVAIPSGRLQAKSKYKIEMSITKSTAGTGTPTVNVRYGTAASTADTSRLLFTWPAANTAAADELKLSVMLTFYSVGSGTSAVIDGMMLAEHELTTTGFGGTGLGSNIIVNTLSSGFDSTPANSQIGVSINGGTAAAWTVRQVHAVLENLA